MRVGIRRSAKGYATQRVSTAEHAELILNRLQPHIGTLRSTLYGKRIQARLLRRFPHRRAAA